MNASNFALGLKSTASGFMRRYQRSGWNSAWTSAKVHAENFLITVRNERGPQRVSCPCCNWTGFAFRSLDCGEFVVPMVECPACHGHERHRLMHLLLTREPPAFMGGAGKVLHFAPEPQIARFIQKNPQLQYFSTDYEMHVYYSDSPGFTGDIHHLPVPDNTFDGIFCIHVLEHVENDRIGLSEIHRVLKPGGQAVIMVPFMMDQSETIEYDQPDPELFYHVRGYSPLDFKHRLQLFEYKEYLPAVLLSPEEIGQYRVPDSQAIYVCTKPGAPK